MKILTMIKHMFRLPSSLDWPFLILFLSIGLISCNVNSQTKKGFDLSNASVPVEEIKDGGPPKDGIPSIDKPVFLNGERGSLDDGARILGVYHQGIAKAYPIAIMNYHEIVNDEFKSDPVVVTYCPLCGSGVAFDAEVAGKKKTFGVSGLLYNSDVLLYDRETETLWSQILNEAVAGPLQGKSLKKLPTMNTTWEKWFERHPETLVLSENTGFKRDYGKNPYPGYVQSRQLYFQVENEDDRYHPKEMVLGLELNGSYKAYPFSELNKVGKSTISDTFEGRNLIIEFDQESYSAEILDADTKEVIPTIANFWFAWFAFHPETEVFEVR